MHLARAFSLRRPLRKLRVSRPCTAIYSRPRRIRQHFLFGLPMYDDVVWRGVQSSQRICTICSTFSFQAEGSEETFRSQSSDHNMHDFKIGIVTPELAPCTRSNAQQRLWLGVVPHIFKCSAKDIDQYVHDRSIRLAQTDKTFHAVKAGADVASTVPLPCFSA